jgi:hypothetical protein
MVLTHAIVAACGISSNSCILELLSSSCSARPTMQQPRANFAWLQVLAALCIVGAIPR